MNNLRKATITTLEVAEMMETEHWKLLRKLEGQQKDGKHIKGYVDILGDNKIVVTDYFIKSTYRTEQNKEMPCYEVTKLGCDFLANKFNGEKGVLFTARYVKKFNEMEHSTLYYKIESGTLKGVASVGCLIERTMKAQKCKPYEVATVLNTLFKQSGINLPDCFVKITQYEQLTLDCIEGSGLV